MHVPRKGRSASKFTINTQALVEAGKAGHLPGIRTFLEQVFPGSGTPQADRGAQDWRE